MEEAGQERGRDGSEGRWKKTSAGTICLVQPTYSSLTIYSPNCVKNKPQFPACLIASRQRWPSTLQHQMCACLGRLLWVFALLNITENRQTHSSRVLLTVKVDMCVQMCEHYAVQLSTSLTLFYPRLVIQLFTLLFSSVSPAKPPRSLEETGRDISIFLVIRGDGVHFY